MEKDRETRVIAIVALCVAVVGLSIGFAAFTKDLNITFSDSNVNVSGDLDIKFLASSDPTDTSTTINGVPDSTTGENIDVDLINPATISTDGTTISGLGAVFNSKGQGVGYCFNIYNNSEYDAYLKGVNFLNYTNAETNKVCTALEGTTQSLVDDACEDIHIVVSMNEEIILDTGTNSFESPKISKDEMVGVCISVVYADDQLSSLLGEGSTSIIPNGDFKINFGEIKFSFSSLEG